MFKNSGAFFIKRSGLRFPTIYRAYLADYITHLLQTGNGMEFFIEGTRSRTGKILPAKYGILKYVYTSYLHKNIQDALIIPISINYECLIELNSILNEWFGKSKIKENFINLVKSLKSIKKDFGDIVLKIDKPQFLSEFHAKRLESTEEENLESLARYIVEGLENQTVIMNSSILSIIFLTGRISMTLETFTDVLNRLKTMIKILGGQLNINSDTPSVLRSLRTFDFIEYSETKAMIVNRTPNDLKAVFQMLYYKNIAFYIVIQEALVALVLFVQMRQNENRSMTTEQAEVRYKFFAEYLREESYHLYNNTQQSAHKIINDNKLGLYHKDINGMVKLKYTTEDEMFAVDVLLSFIHPLLDSYSFVIKEISNLILSDLTERRASDVETSVFLKLQEAFRDGIIVSGESCSINYVKNALEVLSVR